MSFWLGTRLRAVRLRGARGPPARHGSPVGGASPALAPALSAGLCPFAALQLGAVVATPLLTRLLLGTLVPVDAWALLVSTLQARVSAAHSPARSPSAG